MNYLILIALLPAIVLLVYIYRKDGVEHEPVNLILKLLGYGALSVIPAIFLELILSMAMPEQDTYLSKLYQAFVVAALVEENCKYFFLRRTWNHPAFDYQFDAIVYAVTVSLGFAALENVEYVVQYGLATGIVRAVTSVPGHAIFGVFMGYYYGLQKLYSVRGEKNKAQSAQTQAILVPILLHGIYDFFAMSIELNSWFALPFYAFLALLYVHGARRVNQSAKEDRRFVQGPITPWDLGHFGG